MPGATTDKPTKPSTSSHHHLTLLYLSHLSTATTNDHHHATSMLMHAFQNPARYTAAALSDMDVPPVRVQTVVAASFGRCRGEEEAGRVMRFYRGLVGRFLWYWWRAPEEPVDLRVRRVNEAEAEALIERYCGEAECLRRRLQNETAIKLPPFKKFIKGVSEIKYPYIRPTLD